MSSLFNAAVVTSPTEQELLRAKTLVKVSDLLDVQFTIVLSRNRKH